MKKEIDLITAVRAVATKGTDEDLREVLRAGYLGMYQTGCVAGFRVARLKPGTTEQDLRDELDALTADSLDGMFRVKLPVRPMH